ncbi:hypothetical protein N5T77_07530 [Aliarcobacter cryaerophilus]|uniref:helix-turn-helix domain-containing protein n=1 Tax=Aliarcobacter cryaerophilus TaxID=28198 RepID=UPI0021B6012A|nr:hypothetical protein [Aliarcobacter cryaerophilus]MCT7524889.1 hypothetical protein [Aliarcobacter cryaerophilus]
MNINDIFERLFNYFQTSTIRELSEKINMSESTVSKWRQRESVNAIRKKCRELGIYNEIFGDLNTNVNNIQNSNINKVFDHSENSQSQDSININNSPLCEKITKMNQSIVSSFIDAYNILEKKENLKKLYDILGEIQFNQK